MRTIELRELVYFMVLAEELNLGRAASRLYLDRSGLGRAIRRVEDELGVALFAREHGQLAITPAGEALLSHAGEVRQAFESVEACAEAAQRGEVGELVLATSPDARYEVIPPLLDIFARRYPKVSLQRREELARDIVDDLLERRIHLAIATCVPPVPGVVRETLKQMDLRVILASSHALAARGSVDLRELREETFLLPAQELANGPYGCLQAALGILDFVPEHVAHVAGHDEDLQAVRREEGVLVSARTFPGVMPEGVAVLELRPHATLSLELLWREDEASSTLLRFLDFARERRAELGWRKH